MVRLAKYASIIIVLAVICGGICALYDYYAQFRGDSRLEREQSAERVKRDAPVAVGRRFIVGAAIGAFFGALYVGRCVARKQAP